MKAQVSLSKADSLLHKKQESVLHKTDSLRKKLPTDTLTLRELDRIDSATQHIHHKIDSLQNLQLPTAVYQKKLDSLSQRLNQKLSYQHQLDSLSGGWKKKANGILSVQDSLQMKVNQKVAALQRKMKAKMTFLDSLSLEDKSLAADVNAENLTGKLDKMAVPDTKELPQLIQQGVKLPSSELNNPLKGQPLGNGSLDELSKEIKDKENSIKQAVGDNSAVKEMKSVGQEVRDVANDLKKIQQYQKEAREVKENGLAKAESIPKELEKTATNVKEVGVFQGEVKKAETMKNALQQYQEMAMAMQNPDSLKKKAKQMDGKLVDHFAGKEDKLKAGIAQLDKLKKKYKVIEDSRYLPRRAPNEMKGKPLRERIVQGISLQLYKADRVAIDFDPYVAYKLTGRFRPGIGFTYRMETLSKFPLIKNGKVYGYRIFNDLKLYGNFYFHTEWERLHFSRDIISKYRFPIEESAREWKSRINAGLFRTYRISRRFNGQAQILYNVLDLKNFPQNRNSSIRFGFEYKMGKYLKRRK